MLKRLRGIPIISEAPFGRGQNMYLWETFSALVIGSCVMGTLRSLTTLVGFNTTIRAPKAATKRVFLVTDEDNPHNGHVHMDTVAHNILEVSSFSTPHSFGPVITLYRTSTLLG